MIQLNPKDSKALTKLREKYLNSSKESDYLPFSKLLDSLATKYHFIRNDIDTIYDDGTITFKEK